MDNNYNNNYWRDEDVTRTTTRAYCYKKPPPVGGSSNWQHGVPSWEKKFCSAVGAVPWKKLLETKKCIHLYDNIIKWNDSAGKEAFDTAKYNFYANIYNLPCDNWFPDPDIYIDKINWDSEVDPDLILDLETDQVVPGSSSKDEQVVIFGSNFPPSYQSFSPYGWGDSDDDKKKDPNTSPEYSNHQWETEGNERGVADDNSNGWGWNEGNERGVADNNNNGWGWNEKDETAKGDQWEYNNHQWQTEGNERGVADNSNNNNGWGWNENDETTKGDRGHGDSRNDYWGWNMYDNNNYFYGDVNNQTREGSGRYKTSRFRKDENQVTRSRKNNGNWRKSSYSCAPVNPSSHGGVAHRWSPKKPVS